MYVVRTISKYYSTRLIYLIETWISLVTNDVFFVSDTLLPRINLSHIITTEIKCGLSSHSVKSLCCQTIHDFILYRRYEFKYDWFCHFDDDQYVNVNNLKEYLSKLNPNVPYYIGRNSWNKTFKRKKNIHPGHFWFATLGAGVCLSKRTVSLLKPYTENVLEFVNGCLHEYYPDDIYLGFLINNHLNISLTKNNLFHSHLERSLFDDKYSFINTFHQQITFGFKSPRIVPKFLPNLFPKNLDPFGMRKLHCFLYTEIKDCKIRLLKYISNTIK
jgi:fringe protein